MIISKNHPVIAAVRKGHEFERALGAAPEIIFMLSGNIMTLSSKVASAQKAGKEIFVHTDFLEGVSGDRSGLEYLKSIGVKGIITTKSGVINSAKNAGLVGVQRFFIIDSQSVSTALDAIRNTRPDAVELMPGILPSAISGFSAKMPYTPLIAGGLISSESEVRAALRSGAAAVSTANFKLWDFAPKAGE